MTGTKDIKDRMASIRDTQKITNAMYLIASTKLRKAKAELDLTRPYFDALKGEIKRVFRSVDDVESRYFYPADGSPVSVETNACLVITADKGLAGAYNQNVLREAEAMLSRHPDTRLFVVGEYGRAHFTANETKVERSFLYTAQNPTIRRAREISELLLDLYISGEIGKIYVIYTDMDSKLECTPRCTRLLPFHRKDFLTHEGERAVDSPFEFVPSVRAVLDNATESYITGFIYSALVASFCCEQESRMAAMSAANDNAAKMIAELSVRYNRVRQAAITQEITEVSAGAKSQLRKRRKREAAEVDKV